MSSCPVCVRNPTAAGMVSRRRHGRWFDDGEVRAVAAPHDRRLLRAAASQCAGSSYTETQARSTDARVYFTLHFSSIFVMRSDMASQKGPIRVVHFGL